MLSFLCRCRSTHRQGPLPINPAQTLAPRAPSRCRGERPLHRALLLLLGERPQARLGRCTGRRPSCFDHHGTLAQPQSRTGVDEVGASKLSAMVGVRAATELRTTFCSWLGTIAAMVAMVSVTGRAARSHAWEEVILRYGYSVPVRNNVARRGAWGLGAGALALQTYKSTPWCRERAGVGAGGAASARRPFPSGRRRGAATVGALSWRRASAAGTLLRPASSGCGPMQDGTPEPPPSWRVTQLPYGRRTGIRPGPEPGHDHPGYSCSWRRLQIVCGTAKGNRKRILVVRADVWTGCLGVPTPMTQKNCAWAPFPLPLRAVDVEG